MKLTDKIVLFTHCCFFCSIVFLYSCESTTPDKFLEESIVSESIAGVSDNTIRQNSWIYDKMADDYLWADYLPELNDLDLSNSPPTFFSKLLHKDDRFSWIEANESYSGAISLYDDFGLEIQSYLDSKSKKISRVLFVKNQSVAYRNGLNRGDWIKFITMSSNKLEIEVGDVNAGKFVKRQFMNLQSDEKDKTDIISLDSIYIQNGTRIGYFVYNQFLDGENSINNPYRAEFRTLFTKLKTFAINELIIDLRYNLGGHVSMCQFVSGLLLSDEYLGALSGFHSFNSKRAKRQLENTGKEEEELYFPSKKNIGNHNIALSRIFFLVSDKTASASESLINNLQPFVETIIIGTPTRGKGVGSWTIQSSLYPWQLQPITFRYYNRNHETVPAEGLTPNVYADESLATHIYPLGDTREMLLATALYKIIGENSSHIIKAYKTQLIEKITLNPIQDNALLNRKVDGYLFNH